MAWARTKPREDRAHQRHRAGARQWKLRGSLEQALSNYEEAIRTLRNSILLTDFDRRLRSVLLTSASPSEGKSTVAAHLAATHASQQHSVNRRRSAPPQRAPPVPGAQFGGPVERVDEGASWLDAVVVMDDPDSLHILPAGPSTRRASDRTGVWAWRS